MPIKLNTEKGTNCTFFIESRGKDKEWVAYAYLYVDGEYVGGPWAHGNKPELAVERLKGKFTKLKELVDKFLTEIDQSKFQGMGE